MSHLPDATLRRFFAERHEPGRHDAELWAALERATEGGKRFRPLLLMSVHEALGGADVEVAAEVAAAMELLHTAFVVHDDVIDGDRVRRGRPNVSGTFAARAEAAGVAPGRAAGYGDAAGILAGDLALAGAVRLVAGCGAAPGVVPRLLDLLEHALRVSAAGELADVRLSLDTRAADLGTILTMEEHKTAVYSFELPMRAGAVLAGADAATCDRLGELGRLLGVAFQLRDDLDGVFGEEAVTGKSALSDLRAGKCTPLVAHARTTPWWPQIAPFVGDPALDEPAAARVRELLEACGSRQFIEDLAAGYAEAARSVADAVGLAPRLQVWLAATAVRSAA
ncbi:polyprenyl synthetase family protein [Georgenia yuyongxinii]